MVPDPKKIRQLSDELLKDYTSNVNRDDLIEGLTELYGMMSKKEALTGEELNDISDLAYDMAYDIISHGGWIDDSAKSEVEAFRDYFRKDYNAHSPLYVSEGDASDLGFDSWNEARKFFFGRGVTVTKDEYLGTGIDSNQEEWSELFPGIVTPEMMANDWNANDIFNHVIDVLYRNPDTAFSHFDMYSDEGKELTLEVMNHMLISFMISISSIQRMAHRQDR